MFYINNNIKISIQHILILFIILFIVVCIYNKAYITKYYYEIDKYELMRTKYKNIINQQINELSDAKQLVDAQNAIIIEMQQQLNNQQNIQNIGTQNSSHNSALVGSQFTPNDALQTLAPSIPLESISPQYKLGPSMNVPITNDQIMSNLATPINQLINQNSIITNNNTYDTFWQGSNLAPSNMNSNITSI